MPELKKLIDLLVRSKDLTATYGSELMGSDQV